MTNAVAGGWRRIDRHCECRWRPQNQVASPYVAVYIALGGLAVSEAVTLSHSTTSEPMTAIDDLSSQRFHYGTKADLKPGELIEPGNNSNYGKRKEAAYVYLTTTLDAAT